MDARERQVITKAIELLEEGLSDNGNEGSYRSFEKAKEALEELVQY